jgi:thiol-disulfide isomerase/thioredoxin
MKVIKIGAVWCAGCLVMKPRWQEIEKENPWLKTEYYDFDNDMEKINKYKIDSGNLPVFIFLDKKDKEFLRLSGEIDKEKLVQTVDDNKNK